MSKMADSGIEEQMRQDREAMNKCRRCRSDKLGSGCDENMVEIAVVCFECGEEQ